MTSQITGNSTVWSTTCSGLQKNSTLLKDPCYRGLMVHFNHDTIHIAIHGLRYGCNTIHFTWPQQCMQDSQWQPGMQRPVIRSTAHYYYSVGDIKSCIFSSMFLHCKCKIYMVYVKFFWFMIYVLICIVYGIVLLIENMYHDFCCQTMNRNCDCDELFHCYTILLVLCEGIHWWLVDFPHKGLVMWNVSWHEECIFRIVWYLYGLVLISEWDNIDGLMHEKRNSIDNTLELHLSCTDPSTWWLPPLNWSWTHWALGDNGPMRVTVIISKSVIYKLNLWIDILESCETDLRCHRTHW